MNNELASFISDLCLELGLNTAHDYDGVESETDIEIYKKAIIEKIRYDNSRKTDTREYS